MAYDVRTPLNGVLGMTEMLLHGTLDNAQRELTLTVREVIGDVTRLLAQEKRARGVGFTTAVAPSLPGRLRGDVARIRQLISNFVSNAVRFAGEGGVTVAVALAPGTRTDGRNAVRIEILDADAHRTAEQITGMLRRPAGAGPDAAGTGAAGLGLAASLRLVERVSGIVVACSEPGRGCGITLELPLAMPAAPAPTPAPGELQAAAPLDLRVLVAEDNPVNQKVTVHMLSRWGVRADVVADGQAALDALGTGHYDVVLMDVRMPRKDGLQAPAAIRARDAGRGVRTPIVAMTSSLLSGGRKRCMDAGMDGFVSKPIHPGELHAELARWAGRRDSGKRAAA